MTFDSHLTFIQTNATRFPERLAFKLPIFEVDDGTPHQRIRGWTDITYKEFHRDIIRSSGYWLRTLPCPRRSVIGLWMSGMLYRDFVHLFGLINAGFVPQVLNLTIRSVEIAIEYFKRSNIAHILHAPTAPVDSLKNDFHVHELIDIGRISPNHDNEDLYFNSLSSKEENGDDMVLIFHTSGSTSGKPKPVPHTRKWLDGHSRKSIPGIPDGKEIVSLQQFNNGACIVLMPWIDFTGAEFVQITAECKANCLYQLTPVLGKLLREAMANDELLAAFRSLKLLPYGGAAFGENERRWAVEHDIPIVNLYGSTEMGITMKSKHDPTILHPLEAPGLEYEFINPSAGTDTETKDPKNKLVELIIPPSSLDCPYPSLCDPDGRFHTRDLFEEVEPNGFTYRGRLDDIIMMSKGQKCDTLFVESQVMLFCKDLVSICVVVGYGKPSPVLLAEPLDGTMNKILLKEKVGKKAELINKDGFPHEQIRRSDVLILPSGSLPRTPKGNINRSAAERLFKQDIDALF
ncbi:hypothetical protein Clacol_008728 [Clathrus columnatus]|uniref:AMP-dependent synthetase/ligase domain-containing protein n=1 Tax=Clathrus columnatus TaxID=1419009 RepID=A0AAV5AMV6_9AGAM|nr:hypothetical protein Clacol_008728 [Clathrus columnatus]